MPLEPGYPGATQPSMHGPHPGPLQEGEGVAGGAATDYPGATQPLLVDFLVMEYLEGDTLHDLLPGGPA